MQNDIFFVYGYKCEKMWVLVLICDCDGFTLYFGKNLEEQANTLQSKRKNISKKVQVQ